MKYYISDLHLFHENAIAFDPRPFASLQEMHDTILKNWNDRVTNGDMVYILGDVSMRGKKEELIAFVAQLKGRKVLIKGNHDDVSDSRHQLESGFLRKAAFLLYVQKKQAFQSFPGVLAFSYFCIKLSS